LSSPQHDLAAAAQQVPSVQQACGGLQQLAPSEQQSAEDEAGVSAVQQAAPGAQHADPSKQQSLPERK
jgi:hypothetical protein